MKKVVLVFFLLVLSMPTHAMNMTAVLTSLDPCTNEKQRGIVGALVRKLLKNTGMFNEDLIGLGNATERARTQKIWADLEANPGDLHLQKQFCERQGMVSSMALSLIAQLEELCKEDKDKADLSSSASSSVPITQESSRAFELIELSVTLRKLHAHKSLTPEQTTRLIKATNQTRQRIKKRLCIKDGNDTQQDAILKEEPLFDEKMLETASAAQTFPRKIVTAQAIKLLQKAPIKGDLEEEQLTQQFINLALEQAPEDQLLKQANVLAQKCGCDLILQKKTPLPSTNDDPPPPGDDD